jgi:hypothetical protein
LPQNAPGAIPEPAPGEASPQAVPGWTDVVSIAGSGRTTFAVKSVFEKLRRACVTVDLLVIMVGRWLGDVATPRT